MKEKWNKYPDNKPQFDKNRNYYFLFNFFMRTYQTRQRRANSRTLTLTISDLKELVNAVEKVG